MMDSIIFLLRTFYCFGAAANNLAAMQAWLGYLYHSFETQTPDTVAVTI
jgi:hypothetical protein